MKRRLIVSAAVMLLWLTGANAQKVTVKAVNQPAAKVFAEIMRQTDRNFVYPSSLLKGLKVSVTASGEQLEKVLSRMFTGTGITYKIKGKNIVLQAAPKPVVAVEKSVPKNVVVSGYVREEGTDEALIGALVADPLNKRMVQTNSAGFYSLTLPVGQASIEVSYPGYETFESEQIKLTANMTFNVTLGKGTELQEVVVVGSKNRTKAMDASEVGSYNLSAASIQNAPMVLGEADVIKTLQFQPGVVMGADGMAGMNVHGGNTDENLYMLDNIPLYQVNHFGGLFSAFNIEAVKNVDFYKSSFPAKYDGRLSSFVDVNTKDGSMEEHHGSARLGLSSGAVHADGPIWRGHTSYSVSLRRSWYDVLTAPGFAILNAATDKDTEKYNVRYAFNDFNGKVTHRFSPRSSANIMVYYGSDLLSAKTWLDDESFAEKSSQHLRWGNIMAKAGWNYILSPTLFGEFSAAYSRYSSRISSMDEDYNIMQGERTDYYRSEIKSDNSIEDWTLRADFGWRPNNHNIAFGASAVHHSFLPTRSQRWMYFDDETGYAQDFVPVYKAWEGNVYIGDDWSISNRLRVNAGLHASLFSIDSKTFWGISPRATARYAFSPEWSVKGGYSRTVQYVHQLCDSYLSLPTDQWVPTVRGFKPQTADKIFAGVYHTIGNEWTVSLEGFYKWMHNLIDYRDEYQITIPAAGWAAELTSGRGTAKGFDLKISREAGKITGHLAYSLLWADRTFAERNYGKTYPARLDNRHQINLLVNWKPNSKWEFNAAWTGMSGNMVTLPVQVWETPSVPGIKWDYGDYVPVFDGVNNYRMPFYHRLDLSAVRHTKKGFWTFSLYNAYCNMNVIAVRRETLLEGNSSSDYTQVTINTRPVFQKLRLIPLIPSVSYTWLF